MAEINIGSLSGGGGGGGGGTWLKPEMESPANVEITSNQYLRFYKNPATGAYLELNMSGSIPTARIIDSNGNITTIDGNSLDFNSTFDPTNPAMANYLPAEIRIKTYEGGDPAGLYFICLDTNINLAATLNLIRGTYGVDTGSSDPVQDGMLIGELAFWGQDDAGVILPGVFNNINKPSRISVYATEDYTTSARGSEMAIYNTEAGTTTQRGNFRFLGTGQNRMELYGVGNFEDNNPAYFAGVDAVGNIIEIDPSAVGPAIGATWLKPELEAGNVEIFASGNELYIYQENEGYLYSGGQLFGAYSDSGVSNNYLGISAESTYLGINKEDGEYIVTIDTGVSSGEYAVRMQNYTDLVSLIFSIVTASDGREFTFSSLLEGTGTEHLKIDSVSNRVYFHDESYYMPNTAPAFADSRISWNTSGVPVWVNGAASSPATIYNTSSNLTGNRTVSGDGFSLNIFNTSTFQIEDVSNVVNLEVTPTDVGFFDGAFNFSAADPPSNNQIMKMDAGNITGSNVMSETGTAITFAAPLYEIDGAESLPAYSNTGDTDTGMFFPAGDEIGFSTGGTEKVRVDALGLVLVTGFTPTGTADAAGVEGALARDDDYIYVKTSAGWKRSALSTF